MKEIVVKLLEKNLSGKLSSEEIEKLVEMEKNGKVFSKSKINTILKQIELGVEDITVRLENVEKEINPRDSSSLKSFILRYGEKHGEILYKEKIEKTKSQIKSAMMYPVIVTAVGFGVIWGMLVFVVPQFTSMLKETGQELPFITKFVIDTSNFLSHYAVIMIPLMMIGLVFLMNYIKTPQVS